MVITINHVNVCEPWHDSKSICTLEVIHSRDNLLPTRHQLKLQLTSVDCLGKNNPFFPLRMRPISFQVLRSVRPSLSDQHRQPDDCPLCLRHQPSNRRLLCQLCLHRCHHRYGYPRQQETLRLPLATAISIYNPPPNNTFIHRISHIKSVIYEG